MYQPCILQDENEKKLQPVAVVWEFSGGGYSDLVSLLRLDVYVTLHFFAARNSVAYSTFGPSDTKDPFSVSAGRASRRFTSL